MTLTVDLQHRQGDFTLDASFSSAGRLIALFGPSGSGKTTLINLIGGLARPQTGRISVDDRVLFDTRTGVFLPAHRRRIGYVFQDARLFPHLTVRQNLRYGRFFAPAAERYAGFDAMVDLLGIGHLLDRMPATLSGGEKSRVAIGRALLASPKLILMDEPLASLDESRKAEILPHIERLRDEAGIPIVYVSHSLEEVARLATDVVRLAGGKVVASGPADTLLRGIGRAGNLKDGEGEPPFALVDLEVMSLEEGYGLVVLRSGAGHEWRLAGSELAIGARVRARIMASDVMLATEPPRGISALNVLPAVVETLSAFGAGRVLVDLSVGPDRLQATVTKRSVDLLGLVPGKPVHAVIKSVAVDSLPGAWS